MPLPLEALDPWQKKFIATEGNKMLLCGRQIGKSEICAIDAGEYALKHPNQNILIIAPTERQAYALFDKTLDYVATVSPYKIKKGRERPTKHLINLTNGAKIWSLPTGQTGMGIRFLTVHRLYIDECQGVPKAVETAVVPMLLTTGGASIYLGTPLGADNFFAQEFEDPKSDFVKFNKSSEEVIKARKISKYWPKWRRKKALKHIERARRRMSALEFAQEYEGRIIKDLVQFFPDELINKCCILEREEAVPIPGSKLYLGADIARLGGDQSVLIGLSKYDKEKMRMFFLDISSRTPTTETVLRIKTADKKYNFIKIYIDSTGVGGGVLDCLLLDDQTKRKSEGLDNAKKSLVYDGSQKRHTLKEDMYFTLRRLMEQGSIRLMNDNDLKLSLKSVQYEEEDTKTKIFGNYTHCTEALVRAAWCVQDKTLNIWCRYS